MPGAGTQNAPTINIIDNNRNMSTNSAGGGGGCPIPGMQAANAAMAGGMKGGAALA